MTFCCALSRFRSMRPCVPYDRLLWGTAARGTTVQREELDDRLHASRQWYFVFPPDLEWMVLQICNWFAIEVVTTVMRRMHIHLHIKSVYPSPSPSCSPCFDFRRKVCSALDYGLLFSFECVAKQSTSASWICCKMQAWSSRWTGAISPEWQSGKRSKRGLMMIMMMMTTTTATRLLVCAYRLADPVQRRL